MNRLEAMLSLQRVALAALDLVFPPRCASCQRGGHILCPDCLAQMQPLQPPRCAHCYDCVAPDGTCSSCRYHPLQMSGLRAFGHFAGVLRTCIHMFKYEGATRLAEPLGHLLARTYRAHALRADLVVPVPLHSERQRQRGYNHASLLAHACCKEIGVPLREDIVTRQRATAAQVGLNHQARQQNVAGAFRCTAVSSQRPLAGCHILLVDDVCTTGATIEACAAPLFAAGASSIWGLVLARTR